MSKSQLGHPEDAGSTVYVGSDDNSLYAIDAASGSKKWAFRCSM